jgi:hypothetical protein
VGGAHRAGDGFVELADDHGVWDAHAYHELTMRQMVVFSAGLGPALLAREWFPHGGLRRRLVRFGVLDLSVEQEPAWDGDRLIS